MSLARTITQLSVREDGGGWVYDITPSDFNVELGQANWSSPTDEAMSGKLRSNLRGVRLTVRLNLEAIIASNINGNVSASGDTFLTLFNDMITAIAVNGDENVEFSFDGVNWHKVVPESSVLNNIYKGQIGRGTVDLRFKGLNILTTIPNDLGSPVI